MHFQRIADNPEAPEWKRVNGQFWVAYSVAQRQDYPLARSLYQAILDRHGETADPYLLGIVGGARDQIRRIDGMGK